MATLVLVLFLVLLWLECRILAGRPTISPSRFLVAFSLGSIGATVLSFAVQRLVALFIPPLTLGYTVGPTIEEVAKAFPLLFIAYVLRDGRRLAISDLALLGLTIGLGFQFVESNLRASAVGTLPIEITEVTPLIPGWHLAAGGSVVAAGHAIWTGFVGLGIGIGMRMHGPISWLPALGALAIVIFDHTLFNWETYQDILGYSSAGYPNDLIRSIHWLTLRGRIELIGLPLGLIAATLYEGRFTARSTSVRKDLLLPGEQGRPLIPVEWFLALGRARLGPKAVLTTLTYFRHRRAFALVKTDSIMHPDGQSAPRYVANAEARLAEERKTVEESNLQRTSWIPKVRPSRLPGQLLGLFGSNPVIAIYSLALLLLFGLGPALLPGWAAHTLYSAPVALALATTGFGVAIYRIRMFRRQPAPNPEIADGETLSAYHIGSFVAAAGVLSGFVALAGWLLPRPVFATGSGLFFLSGPFTQWGLSGGNQAGLLGAAAGLAAGIAAKAVPPMKQKPKLRPIIAIEIISGAGGMEQARSPIQTDIKPDVRAVKDSDLPVFRSINSHSNFRVTLRIPYEDGSLDPNVTVKLETRDDMKRPVDSTGLSVKCTGYFGGWADYVSNDMDLDLGKRISAFGGTLTYPGGHISCTDGGTLTASYQEAKDTVRTYQSWIQQGFGDGLETLRLTERVIRALLAQMENLPNSTALQDLRGQLEEKLRLIHRGYRAIDNPQFLDQDRLAMVRAYNNLVIMPGVRSAQEEGQAINDALAAGHEMKQEMLLNFSRELTVGLYQFYVGQTLAGQVWTLLTGTDILGNELGTKDYWLNSLDLASQWLMLGGHMKLGEEFAGVKGTVSDPRPFRTIGPTEPPHAGVDPPGATRVLEQPKSVAEPRKAITESLSIEKGPEVSRPPAEPATKAEPAAVGPEKPLSESKGQPAPEPRTQVSEGNEEGGSITGKIEETHSKLAEPSTKAEPSEPRAQPTAPKDESTTEPTGKTEGRPGTTKPVEPAEPGPERPRASEPTPSQPEAVRPAEPGEARPEATKPAEPDTPKQSIDRPEGARPSEPNGARPEATRPQEPGAAPEPSRPAEPQPGPPQAETRQAPGSEQAEPAQAIAPPPEPIRGSQVEHPSVSPDRPTAAAAEPQQPSAAAAEPQHSPAAAAEPQRPGTEPAVAASETRVVSEGGAEKIPAQDAHGSPDAPAVQHLSPSEADTRAVPAHQLEADPTAARGRWNLKEPDPNAPHYEATERVQGHQETLQNVRQTGTDITDIAERHHLDMKTPIEEQFKRIETDPRLSAELKDEVHAELAREWQAAANEAVDRAVGEGRIVASREFEEIPHFRQEVRVGEATQERVVFDEKGNPVRQGTVEVRSVESGERLIIEASVKLREAAQNPAVESDPGFRDMVDELRTQYKEPEFREKLEKGWSLDEERNAENRPGNRSLQPLANEEERALIRRAVGDERPGDAQVIEAGLKQEKMTAPVDEEIQRRLAEIAKQSSDVTRSAQETRIEGPFEPPGEHAETRIERPFEPPGEHVETGEDPATVQAAHDDRSLAAARAAAREQAADPAKVAAAQKEELIEKIHEDASSLARARDLGVDVDGIAKKNGLDLSRPIKDQLAGLPADQVDALDSRMQNTLDQVFKDPRWLRPDDDLNLVTQAEVLHKAAAADPSVVETPAYRDVVDQLRDRFADPAFRDKFERGVVVFDSDTTEPYLGRFADPETRAAVTEMMGETPFENDAPTARTMADSTNIERPFEPPGEQVETKIESPFEVQPERAESAPASARDPVADERAVEVGEKRYLGHDWQPPEGPQQALRDLMIKLRGDEFGLQQGTGVIPETMKADPTAAKHPELFGNRQLIEGARAQWDENVSQARQILNDNPGLIDQLPPHIREFFEPRLSMHERQSFPSDSWWKDQVDWINPEGATYRPPPAEAPSFHDMRTAVERPMPAPQPPVPRLAGEMELRNLMIRVRGSERALQDATGIDPETMKVNPDAKPWMHRDFGNEKTIDGARAQWQQDMERVNEIIRQHPDIGDALGPDAKAFFEHRLDQFERQVFPPESWWKDQVNWLKRDGQIERPTVAPVRLTPEQELWAGLGRLQRADMKDLAMLIDEGHKLEYPPAASVDALRNYIEQPEEFRALPPHFQELTRKALQLAGEMQPDKNWPAPESLGK